VYPSGKQKMRPQIPPPYHQRGREPHAQLMLSSKALEGIPPSTSLIIMMKIIKWNIRGFNGRSKHRTL